MLEFCWSKTWKLTSLISPNFMNRSVDVIFCTYLWFYFPVLIVIIFQASKTFSLKKGFLLIKECCIWWQASFKHSNAMWNDHGKSWQRFNYLLCFKTTFNFISYIYVSLFLDNLSIVLYPKPVYPKGWFAYVKICFPLLLF